MTKLIRWQTSPFKCGTPLFFVYHFYKSFIRQFIQKKKSDRCTYQKQEKEKRKVDNIMHKFTRRQVSSVLNYPKMYNIYTLRQVTSKQQVTQKMYFLICLIFNIVIM